MAEPRAGVELMIPLTIDDTLCPPERMSPAVCQHVGAGIAEGRSGTTSRGGRDLMIATWIVTRRGFACRRDRRQILSPLDLESEFGCGRRYFSWRADAQYVLGAADARATAICAAVEGIYHCGSGAHPGGGVHRRPGHNAAR